MALTQRLQMRQSQALVMTPQLMQAIKLLQLSNLDLAAYVEGELEKNPLLERAAEGEPGVSTATPSRSQRNSSGDRDTDGIGVVADRIDESLETSRSAIEERLGTDLENEFPDEASSRPAHRHGRAPAPSRLGRRRRAAGARTATTISRPSCRPSRRSPIISPSNCRWRSPIRCGG